MTRAAPAKNRKRSTQTRHLVDGRADRLACTAVSFIFCRMKAEICEGEYCLPSSSTQASPFDALEIL